MVEYSENDLKNMCGIALETNINNFIHDVGGCRVSDCYDTRNIENADYFFKDNDVILELKNIEKEYIDDLKMLKIYEKSAKLFSAGEIIRMEPQVRGFFSNEKLEIYRKPLSRIVKKASRQIFSTKSIVNSCSANGILMIVNENCTSIGSDIIVSLLSRILIGSGRNIDAFIYITNHYVQINNSEYANLLWIPVYSEHCRNDLYLFVNWLGSQWRVFNEKNIGKFDNVTTTEDIKIILGSRPIK